MRELRVEDALMYLDQVKMEFGDRPQIYNEFLDIMKNFKSQQIDTPGVIERVSNLFHGNKKLVLGFNTFLPEGYSIEVPSDGAPAVFRAPGQIGVTQIRTHAYNLPGAQQQAPQQQAHARAQQQAQAQVQATALAQAQAQQQAAQGASPLGGPSHAVPAAATARPSFPGSQRGPDPAAGKHSMQHGKLPSTTLTPENTGLAPSGAPNHQGPSQTQTQAQAGNSALSARARLAAAEKQGRAMAEQVKMHQQAARNSRLQTWGQESFRQPGEAPSSQQKHPHPQMSSVPPSFARNVQQQQQQHQGEPKQPPVLQQQRPQQRPGQHHPPSQQLQQAQGQAEQKQPVPKQEQPQLQQAQVQGQAEQKQQTQKEEQQQKQQPQPAAGSEPPAGNQPVEFDRAIHYVTTIKKRFVNQPATYKNFLKILHTYQQEQRGIKEVLDEVAELFCDHPDLLQDFTYFLPDAVQYTAKCQLEPAVRLAKERKKKAAALAASQVAEARTQAILKAKIAAKDLERKRPAVPPPTETVSVPPPPLASPSVPIPGAAPRHVPPPVPPTGPISASTSFPRRQTKVPPPVPFGAAVGRSEEREKEICRNAQYGTLSFAPVRPPKKDEPSLAEIAEQKGRPRWIPVPPIPQNAKEETFFSRAKTHLNLRELSPDKPAGSRRHTPYAEFLKCLHLYGAGILNREELVSLLKCLFEQGHAPKTGANAGGGKSNSKVAKAAAELLSEFESLLTGRGPYANQQSTAKDHSKYGSLSMRMCDFSGCNAVTPSYMKYPSDHPQKRYSHSGQSLWREDAAVLNTTVCSVGDVNSKRFSIEAFDGPSMRCNVYEEVLNKIEDERYEMDMAIERNFSTMRLIQPIADEVTAQKEQEERDGQPIGRMHYNLLAKALGPNHIGAIARLYGDKGDEVVQLLSTNPVAVLPVVYKRLREKNEEWRAVRTEWNKQWKKAQADNFEGSFDVECHFQKRQLDQELSSNHFISECKNAKIKYETRDTDDSEAKRKASKASFGVEYSDASFILFQPFVAVSASKNVTAHKAVHSLIEAQLDKACKKPADRQIVSMIWSEMLIPMFNLPLHWFTETLRRSAFSKKNVVLTKYDRGQRVRTTFGDGIVKRFVQQSMKEVPEYEVALTFGTAHLHPSAIVHSLPLTSSKINYVRQNGVFHALKETFDGSDDVVANPKGFQMFGTEKMYVFLRFYCVLMAHLQKIEKTYFSKPTNNSDVDKIQRVEVPSILAPLAPSHVRKTGASSLRNQFKGYQGYITAVVDNIRGKLSQKGFEDVCRVLCKHSVPELAIVPRMVQKCVRTMMAVGKEDCFRGLVDYSRIGKMDVNLLRSLCLHVSEAAFYRIQFDRHAQTMMFSFVPEGSSVAVSSQKHEKKKIKSEVVEGGHRPREDVEMQHGALSEKAENGGGERRSTHSRDDNEEGELGESYNENHPNKRARVGLK